MLVEDAAKRSRPKPHVVKDEFFDQGAQSLDLPSSFGTDGVLIVVRALLYCLQRIERGAELVISHVGGRGSVTGGPGHGCSGTGGLPGCGVGCVGGFPRGRHARVPVRPLACRRDRVFRSVVSGSSIGETLPD